MRRTRTSSVRLLVRHLIDFFQFQNELHFLYKLDTQEFGYPEFGYPEFGYLDIRNLVYTVNIGRVRIERQNQVFQ